MVVVLGRKVLERRKGTVLFGPETRQNWANQELEIAWATGLANPSSERFVLSEMGPWILWRFCAFFRRTSDRSIDMCQGP